MVRWLSASLMLLLCLFLAGSGVIEPTVVRVSSFELSSNWFGMAAYGVIQGATRPSDAADTSPAIAVHAEYFQSVHRCAIDAHGPPPGFRNDASLTYLRTARLRL